MFHTTVQKISLYRIQLIELMRYLIIFVVFWLSTFALQAQNDFKVHKIDGKEYYLHKVEPGNTVYGIAKKYSVPEAKIYEANPGTENGIHINQELRIPVKAVIKKAARKNPPALQGEFLIHKVQAKETLYSLSTRYKVAVKDIEDVNPELKNGGLKQGSEIRIPVKKVKDAPAASVVPAEPDSLIQHQVVKGDTKYSLAKKYNVMLDSIAIVNNGLPGGLKVGSTIRIPRLSEAYKLKKFLSGKLQNSQADTVEQETNLIRDSYNVALLLPFYLDKNDTLEAKRRKVDKPEIYRQSKVGLDFYMGAIQAVDSLRNAGHQVRLFVYDTQRDTNKVKEILRKPEIEEVSLFIGPLYTSNFRIVANYAKQRGVGIVSPVPQNNRILLGNSFVTKVSPSIPVQVQKLARYIVWNKQDANVLLINSTRPADFKLVDAFRQKSTQLLKRQDSAGDTIPQINLYTVSAKRIKGELVEGKENIIVVPSGDQAFVSELLLALNNMVEKSRKDEEIDYQISIYGIDKWKRFNNMEPDYLHRLNVHVTSPEYIDYTSATTQTFIRSFRSRFETEPARYSYLGFDVTYYFLQALSEYGIAFHDKLPELAKNMNSISLDFFQTGVESGYENDQVFILRFEDYQLVKVK